MTKKHFIALADAIVEAKGTNVEFSEDQIEYLATFCGRQNNQFNFTRWLGYIAGKRGPNGGKVK